MKTINIAAIIQALFFYGYVAYVWKKIGIQKSISESWYQLPPGTNNRFVIFAAGTGIPFWFYGLLGIPLYAEMMFMLSGFFMFCISVASTFKASKQVEWIHNTSTGLAIALALGGIVVIDKSFYWVMSFAISISIASFFLEKKTRLWWLEIIIFTWIIIKLLTIPWKH